MSLRNYYIDKSSILLRDSTDRPSLMDNEIFYGYMLVKYYCDMGIRIDPDIISYLNFYRHHRSFIDKIKWYVFFRNFNVEINALMYPNGLFVRYFTKYSWAIITNTVYYVIFGSIGMCAGIFLPPRITFSIAIACFVYSSFGLYFHCKGRCGCCKK